jgi:hypothetical protein
VEGTLTPSDEVRGDERQEPCVSLRDQWQSRADAVHQPLANVRSRVQAGLCGGGEAADRPEDNVDVERWCKRPKGHERRRQGRCHAGGRIGQQGPTRLLALDAHVYHEDLFTVDDLQPYGQACAPTGQQQALKRGKMMRKARSRKKRHALLVDLEKRYLDSS